jgi:hypothetical protein
MRFSHRYDCVAIANRFLHQPFRFHLPGQVVDDLGQRDRQPAAQHAFCFNFSLCLSRAGLGSMVAFSVEIAAKKRRFWHRSRSITLMSPLKPARNQQPFVSASLMHAQSLSWQMIIISCKKTALQNKPFRFVRTDGEKSAVEEAKCLCRLSRLLLHEKLERQPSTLAPCPLPIPRPAQEQKNPDGPRCFQRFTMFVPSLSWQNRSFSFENRSKRPPNKLKRGVFASHQWVMRNVG